MFSPAATQHDIFQFIKDFFDWEKILCGTYKLDKRNNKEYKGYRCRNRQTTCTYKQQLSEMKIEKYLLKNLKELLQNEITVAEVERTKPKPKPKNNLAALKEQLRRLNVMYMAGNKSDAEYLQEDAELKALIKKAEQDAPPPERDITALKELLTTDFEEIYKTFDQEDKRRFWRSIIKEIKVNGLEVKDVIFF